MKASIENYKCESKHHLFRRAQKNPGFNYPGLSAYKLIDIYHSKSFKINYVFII